MLSNILVAFDGSEHALRAAKFAAELVVLLQQSQCTLITVLTFTKDEAEFLGASEEEYEKALKSYENKIFKEARKYFKDKDIPLHTVVKEGDPPHEIVKYAETNAVDHIIIGTRGLGNIKGTLLGSVSSKVIHTARCPVTVVRDTSVFKSKGV
jgi:nucleotide-binding universal stress UspA family protein